MEIIPAIDIRNGKCVRLTQGNYNQETIFDENPLNVARKWVEFGAKKLHIVDLDGSREGENNNFKLINQIKKTTNISVQVGGGIRNFNTAKQMLNNGVDRIIFGTAAIENPEEVKKSIDELGKNKIIVALDSQNGYVKTRGWLKKTSVKVIDLLFEMERIGVNRFMFTDTLKDGTLQHPNFESIEKIRDLTESNIIIAGGISDINDIIKLSALGIDEVVLGMSLYTGTLDLRCAIKKLETTK
ncbi:MAG: 1-(5-phosphoribosyl)-5-[(5-phosphoribosylamino)methylideneamino]imidazole-4-carboxamide isomerase [Chloroflexi bacterium]|nr:1-(5-phosphoribosyl)-5-[(5-phosphoribosylamino)methylideneamino]imidazole-4-carboxamide isomerase [Chloroflexota bacterium]